jgi:hypothetical protein
MATLQTTNNINGELIDDNQCYHHSQWKSMKQLLRQRAKSVDRQSRSSDDVKRSKGSRIRQLFSKRTSLDSATEDEEEDLQESPEEDFCLENQITQKIDAIKTKINQHNSHRCYYLEYSRSFRTRRAIAVPPVDLPDAYKLPKALSTLVGGKQVAICKNMWCNQRRRIMRKVPERIWEKC